jgi:hypothetical protein
MGDRAGAGLPKVRTGLGWAREAPHRPQSGSDFAERTVAQPSPGGDGTRDSRENGDDMSELTARPTYGNWQLPSRPGIGGRGSGGDDPDGDPHRGWQAVAVEPPGPTSTIRAGHAESGGLSAVRLTAYSSFSILAASSAPPMASHRRKVSSSYSVVSSGATREWAALAVGAAVMTIWF